MPADSIIVVIIREKKSYRKFCGYSPLKTTIDLWFYDNSIFTIIWIMLKEYK